MTDVIAMEDGRYDRLHKIDSELAAWQETLSRRRDSLAAIEQLLGGLPADQAGQLAATKAPFPALPAGSTSNGPAQAGNDLLLDALQVAIGRHSPDKQVAQPAPVVAAQPQYAQSCVGSPNPQVRLFTTPFVFPTTSATTPQLDVPRYLRCETALLSAGSSPSANRVEEIFPAFQFQQAGISVAETISPLASSVPASRPSWPSPGWWEQWDGHPQSTPPTQQATATRELPLQPARKDIATRELPLQPARKDIATPDLPLQPARSVGEVLYLPFQLHGIPVLQGRGSGYLVDNSLLKSPTTGLSYRVNKNFQDRDSKQRGPRWGETVTGIVEEANGGMQWLKVIVAAQADTGDAAVLAVRSSDPVFVQNPSGVRGVSPHAVPGQLFAQAVLGQPTPRFAAHVASPSSPMPRAVSLQPQARLGCYMSVPPSPMSMSRPRSLDPQARLGSYVSAPQSPISTSRPRSLEPQARLGSGVSAPQSPMSRSSSCSPSPSPSFAPVRVQAWANWGAPPTPGRSRRAPDGSLTSIHDLAKYMGIPEPVASSRTARPSVGSSNGRAARQQAMQQLLPSPMPVSFLAFHSGSTAGEAPPPAPPQFTGSEREPKALDAIVRKVSAKDQPVVSGVVKSKSSPERPPSPQGRSRGSCNWCGIRGRSAACRKSLLQDDN